LKLLYLKLPRPITYAMAVSSEISINNCKSNNYPGFEETNCSRVALLSIVTLKWTYLDHPWVTYMTTVDGKILSTCLKILQSIYQTRKKHEFIIMGLQFSDPCMVIILGVTAYWLSMGSTGELVCLNFRTLGSKIHEDSSTCWVAISVM
jgi:hypothetical protein